MKTEKSRRHRRGFFYKMPIDLDKHNEAVKEWSDQLIPVLKNKAAGYGVTHRADSPSSGSSMAKLRNRTFTKDGAINRVSVGFPRTLIYTHKGAGKGRGGSKGSRWVDKYGNAKKTNPKSFGKMGTAGRTAKPFINDALDGPEGVDKLATISAEHLGDALVGSLFIK